MNSYSVKDMESRVRLISDQVAKEFRLPLKSIEFIKHESLYGSCGSDGTLRIKLQWPDGELVPVMEVWRTVAHELAHLVERNHLEGFWQLNKKILERISKLVGFRVRPEIAIFRRDLGDYKVIN